MRKALILCPKTRPQRSNPTTLLWSTVLHHARFKWAHKRLCLPDGASWKREGGGQTANSHNRIYTETPQLLTRMCNHTGGHQGRRQTGCIAQLPGVSSIPPSVQTYKFSHFRVKGDSAGSLRVIIVSGCFTENDVMASTAPAVSRLLVSSISAFMRLN